MAPPDSSSIQNAYNEWAEIYETDENPTRDLNARVLRDSGLHLEGRRILELGCGTGLNTVWLADRARSVTGIDFSGGMLERARKRTEDRDNVRLLQADITTRWDLPGEAFDAVVASLVLEHVDQLGPVFGEAARVLTPGGLLYLAELHPYKQLRKSQARFRRPASGEEVRVEAYEHSLSEFLNEAVGAGFRFVRAGEWSGDGEDIPRLLTLLMHKPES